MARVQRTKTGQLTMTFPRNLAQALGVEKGSELQFRVAGKDLLELRIRRDLNG